MRTAVVIWACACASTVVWILLDSYLHERRQRNKPSDRAARIDQLAADLKRDPIVVHDALSPAEMEQLDFLADMEDFREDYADPEILTAFHHWVQIHSDANVDESRVARVRDEWEGMAA